MGDEHRGPRVRCTPVSRRACGMGRPHGGNAGALGTWRGYIGAVPSLAACAQPNPAFERTLLRPAHFVSILRRAAQCNVGLPAFCPRTPYTNACALWNLLPFSFGWLRQFRDARGLRSFKPRRLPAGRTAAHGRGALGCDGVLSARAGRTAVALPRSESLAGSFALHLRSSPLLTPTPRSSGRPRQAAVSSALARAAA